MGLLCTRQSLADCQAELLVCGVSADGKVDAGAIGAIFQEAGGELGESLRAGLSLGSRQAGSVILTPPFQLGERGVKGLALVVVRPLPSVEQLRQATRILVHQALSQGFLSLACPALGCGAEGMAPAQAAYALLEVLAPEIRNGLQVELALPRDSDYNAYLKVARQLKLVY